MVYESRQVDGGIGEDGVAFAAVQFEVFIEIRIVAEAEVMAERAMGAHVAAENAEGGRGGEFFEFGRSDETGCGGAGKYGG